MEIKIKSMKYEDFRDNEYLETYAKLQQEGVPVAIGVLDELIELGAFQFALAADVRYELLRYRVHVGRCCPV